MKSRSWSPPKVIGLVCLGAVMWLGWPLYGFVSNQFEVARLPFGWQQVPNETPSTQRLEDPRYSDAGDATLAALQARRAKIQAPSLSAAVAIGGELVWTGAVGWSDIQGEVPATPDTIYRIGSTSKAITATVLARLTTQKAIDLDAPISTYMVDLPNSDWLAMTSRQLASHTAGLPDYEDNSDWIGFYQSLALKKRFASAEASLSVFDSSQLAFQPGTDFGYSGYGTTLLSAVIADAADMPFETAMSEFVLKPVSADRTVLDHSSDLSEQRAVSYQEKAQRYKPWRRVDLSHKVAAGGLASTPSDLVLIGSIWLDNMLVDPDTRAEFWQPNPLSVGEPHHQDYALGWRKKTWPIACVGEITHFNHGGISKGSQAWLMVIPEYETSVAITMNARTDQFFDFADVYVDILETFLPVNVGDQSTCLDSGLGAN